MSNLVRKAFLLFCAITSFCFARNPAIRVVIEKGAEASVLNLIEQRISRDDLQIAFAERAPSSCKHDNPTIFILKKITKCKLESVVARLQVAPVVGEDFLNLYFESPGHSAVEYEIRRNEDASLFFVIFDFIAASRGNSDRLLSSAGNGTDVETSKAPARIIVRNVLLVGLASMSLLYLATSIAAVAVYISGKTLRYNLGLVQAERRASDDRISMDSSSRVPSRSSIRAEGGASDTSCAYC